MRRTIVLIFLVFAAISVPFLSNSYLLAGDMGWSKERQPGDPLDGYWYMSFDDVPGCFEDLIVYKVKDDNFAQILTGIQLDAEIRAKRSQDLVIEFRTDPGVVSKFFVEDRGQVLWAYRFEQKSGSGIVKSEELAEPFFTTCDKPTTMGVLSSLVSRVFDPAEPTRKVTITQS